MSSPEKGGSRKSLPESEVIARERAGKDASNASAIGTLDKNFTSETPAAKKHLSRKELRKHLVQGLERGMEVISI